MWSHINAEDLECTIFLLTQVTYDDSSFSWKTTPIFCLLGCPSLVSSSDTKQTFTLRAGTLNLGHRLMFCNGTKALPSSNSPYPCHNDLLTCLSLNSELLTDKDLISLSSVFNGETVRVAYWTSQNGLNSYLHHRCPSYHKDSGSTLFEKWGICPLLLRLWVSTWLWWKGHFWAQVPQPASFCFPQNTYSGTWPPQAVTNLKQPTDRPTRR